MLPTQTIHAPIFLVGTPTATNNNDEISRVLAAAVVNHQFRSQLLNDPLLALDNGYMGEPFSLTEDQRSTIASIHADTLSDLAIQLTSAISRKNYYLR
jgi:hypothetical protein